MKIAGIICEYNPFHKGHQYQIQKLRQKGYTHIVGIMSPNFVQRGDIAIFEKRQRAYAALLGGLDLVIELPTPYAVSSAGQFAFGGVNILKNMGCIDAISFGSESDEDGMFFDVAKMLVEKQINSKIKTFLSDGVSYQTAVTMAVGENNNHDYTSFLQSPNNLLGTEYVKQMITQNAEFDVEIIKRQGSNHLDDKIKEGFSSATAIRNEILNSNISRCKNSLTEDGYEIFSLLKPSHIGELEQAMLYRLRSLEKDDFRRFADVSEGLDNRFQKALREENSVVGIMNFVKSKRYAYSRIRRIIINILLDIPKEYAKINAPYIRVLGCNKNGNEVIKLMKKTAVLPVSHSLAKLAKEGEYCRKFSEVEERATDIFSLCQKPIWCKGEEYKINSIRI
ncbi:MAG: nucleotidyltransferase family protein [Oscillospiraceae bacterium]